MEKINQELYRLKAENDSLKIQLLNLNNLTELLQASEEKFRNFFEDDLAGDFITDGQGIILDCNNSFLDIYGYLDKSQILGKEICTIYKTRNDFEDIKLRLKAERKIRNLEGERVKKDGSIITVMVNLTADQDENGEITEIKGFVYDISKRKALENELIIARNKAEESNRLKSAFLANMSHEIRTPMNAIIGFASLLKRADQTRQEMDRNADIIINSGNHLLSLINDIIDISKIESNKLYLSLSEFNVNALLSELSIFFHSQIVAKNKNSVQLSYKTSGHDIIISSDETRLRQILINLIGNAIKFTEDGYVDYGFEIEGTKLKFFVKDSGIGIPKEDHSIIFERFRQANSSTEKLYGGTGLGLSISKACVELLGGEIWLESEPGKGSEFYFTINYTPITKPKDFLSTSLKTELIFSGENILIAEDDEVNYLYLKDVFKECNLNIHRTKNGDETLSFIQNNPGLNLVIMDIQMPLKNGWEVTKIIRSQQNMIPVIAHSAYAFESDRLESYNSGCNLFLAKPTHADEILKKVYSLLYIK